MKQPTPLLAIAFLALLAGCGFQLRGMEAVPEALREVYVSQPPASRVAQPLIRQLRANKITLLDSAEAAPYRVHLLSESHDRRAATLTSRAKTQEYELRSQVRFEIRNGEGELLVEPQTLTIERVYRFDEDNVTAQDAEEALLRREMYRELARQVMRRYLSLGRSGPTVLP